MRCTIAAGVAFGAAMPNQPMTLSPGTTSLASGIDSSPGSTSGEVMAIALSLPLFTWGSKGVMPSTTSAVSPLIVEVMAGMVPPNATL